MRKPSLISVVSFFLLFSGWPQVTQAQFSYEWHRDGQPVSGTIEAVAGSTLTLQVYLREQTGGTVLQTEKLISAGVRARYDNPIGVVSVPDTSAMSRNPLLTDWVLQSVNNPTDAQFSAAVRLTEPGLSPDANNRILLGSFSFQVTPNVGNSTLLRAIDIPNSNDTFTGTLAGGGGHSELDALITPADLTIHVSPVPEPTTVMLIGALGLSTARIIRRRRRNGISSRS
jgi:hypothetical protein